MLGLGPQTYANGYKDAGVYVNGKVEQGVAGRRLPSNINII